MTARQGADKYRLKAGCLTSHGRILSAIRQLSAQTRILDVGTSTGYLGNAIAHMGFQNVFGIEKDAAAANEAKPYYRELKILDVENDAMPWTESSFDVILCADVLEHLAQPHYALRRLVPLLAPDGLMVVSLPNIAHWSMRASLFFGRFKYTHSGLTDRTHLRFFTKHSMEQLIREAGLGIINRYSTPLPVAHLCKGWLSSLCWRAFEWADWCLASLWPGLFAYQIVFFARKDSKAQ